MVHLKAEVPRTMDNCFVEGKCDYCGKKFDGLKLIWVYAEHTCCSQNCVVADYKDARLREADEEEEDL